MGTQHEYKGKIIENIPYKNEPRWFIFNEDGTRDEVLKYPKKTLKEAKAYIDGVFKGE